MRKEKQFIEFLIKMIVYIIIVFFLAALLQFLVSERKLNSLMHAPALAGILFILWISFATIYSHCKGFTERLPEQGRGLPAVLVSLQCAVSVWLVYMHFKNTEGWSLLCPLGFVAAYLCIWAWYDAVIILLLKKNGVPTQDGDKILLHDFIDTFKFIDAPVALSSLLVFLTILGMFVLNSAAPRIFNIKPDKIVMICSFASGCAIAQLYFSSIMYLGNFSQYVFNMREWYFGNYSILPKPWESVYEKLHVRNSDAEKGKE